MSGINTLASSEDQRAIADWFIALQKHVNNVDLPAARQMFDEGVIGFGSISTVIGREKLEATQWRPVWPTMENFQFQIDGLEARLSCDRNLALAAVTFMSTGVAENGTRFDRPGRATMVLERTNPQAEWKSIHIHFSLNPGVPQKSFGKKPVLG